jgi:hypothetical protein
MDIECQMKGSFKVVRYPLVNDLLISSPPSMERVLEWKAIVPIGPKNKIISHTLQLDKKILNAVHLGFKFSTLDLDTPCI